MPRFIKSKFFLNSPATLKSDAMIHLHGEDIPDPYQHLADLASPDTQKWQARQEKKYQSYLNGIEGASKTEETLSQVLDASAKGIPTRAGDHYLFYYKGSEDNQPKLMISDMAEGTGRVLVDPGDGRALSGVYICPDGKHVGYRISEGGTWEARLEIKNIETDEVLSDTIPKSGSMWWDKDGKGFVYSHISTDGTNRVVLEHHVLGESIDKDTSLGSGSLTNSGFRNHSSYRGSQEWLFTVDGGLGDLKANVFLKDSGTGEYWKVFDAKNFDYMPIADTGHGILMRTTHDAPNGKVVLFDPQNPAPENWKTIIPEHEKDALQHVFLQHDRLFGLYTHDCADQVRIFDTKGKSLGDMPIPIAPKIAVHEFCLICKATQGIAENSWALPRLDNA